jgi:hypothetical protein
MDEKSKYTVVVSGKARDMLYEHAMFLAQVSINAAYGVFDKFEEKVISLEQMPERCPSYDNPYIQNGKYRKLALGNNLLILFQVSGRTVYIELVVDARAENQLFL